MDTSQQAISKITKIEDQKAITPLESFNYLNLEDSVLTRNTSDKNSPHDTNSKDSKRVSKGIVKIVHQISKIEDENQDNNETDSMDMTSQLLAQEIFSPIVW